MPRFYYKAASTSGEVLEGHMEAGSQEAVVKRLQAQGHVPIRAEEVGLRALGGVRLGAGSTRLRDRIRRRVSSQDISVLTVELSTLLGAGLPLDKALELLIAIAGGGGVREILVKVHADVHGGADLSRAMERHPRVFSRFYLNMVRAGEASGALALALGRLAEFTRRGQELRDTLVSALIYPLILVVFAIVSVMVIVGTVIPRVSAMFDEAGAELPIATQIVVGAGAFVHDYWWALTAIGLGGFFYARSLWLAPATRARIDRRLLAIPFAGELIAKHEAARFSRTLGTLLQNGIPLLDAIAIAKEVVGNQAMGQGIARVATSVRGGQGLSRPLMEAGVFPRLSVHLLQVGEQTGQLEQMLLQVAEIYERDVQLAIKRLVDMLGPVLILVLGVLIAGIILSMLAAILSINELAF